eukprot:5718188-Pyramimonas_sp.AAC.1
MHETGKRWLMDKEILKIEGGVRCAVCRVRCDQRTSARPSLRRLAAEAPPTTQYPYTLRTSSCSASSLAGEWIRLSARLSRAVLFRSTSRKVSRAFGSTSESTKTCCSEPSQSPHIPVGMRCCAALFSASSS